MCGFCGFTGYLDDNGNIINKMMDKIVHRGPDSAGVHLSDELTLGFRRLSIIGLEDGTQPMYNEDESVVIVFNGEIYNYKVLKEELSDKGHVFKTHADTEVLVHLYEEYKFDMLKYIRGMFAFVIYDKNDGLTFAARDFFGIKPFYYSVIDNELLFGSEIKSFLPFPKFQKEVNLTALENYLTFQYSVLPETFFKGVFKLLPGHYLSFKDGELNVSRYFEPEFKPEEKSLQETIGKVEEVLLDSVENHKVSDVEVGSFLSSGVDSSFVAAAFKGDKTFTVGFDYEKYNEISYAKSFSEKVGIENYNKVITTKEYWDNLAKVQYHMDEPLADPSAVALYFVSGVASEHVKVVLSGEGADEFFGGYNIYKESLDLKIVTDLPRPIRKFLARLVSLVPFSFRGKNFFIRASKDVEQRFIGNAYIFTKQEREKILKNPEGRFDPTEITKPFYEKVSHLDDVTKMQYIDINLWMVGDILLKADKMSMAHSLEVRVPFLDKEVFRVASRIQADFRVNKTATKYAFRMASRGHLPDDVANKRKLGFPVPIRIWLKEDKYYNKIKKAFESETSGRFFVREHILELLDNHKNGVSDNSRKIWAVYMFLVWYGEFFERI